MARIVMCNGFETKETEVDEATVQYGIIRTREMIPCKLFEEHYPIPWYETEWVPNGHVSAAGYPVWVPRYLIGVVL